MDLSLREGYARWRELGVRRGTAAALRIAAPHVRAPLRRARLKLRPLSVSSGELNEALGTREVSSILRGVVPAAMPTVASFERRLAELPDDERTAILEVAQRVAGHTFDLLGSGPTDLGPQIDWRLDFKSGRRWPLDHISLIKIAYPDDSDIKVPWELSRFQHLPVLAAAYRLTGERRWLDEIGVQLTDWIAANPVEFGPNWACTMDVAIRGANWLAALALIADAAPNESWLERVLASLLLHGRFIRSHLEWAPIRSNHYLSDVVGLLCIASLFSSGAEGRAWAEWAASQVASELEHQVRADGCDHEASIPYHRLVTELFLCAVQAADVLSPGAVSSAQHERLEKMLGFVADYTRPDGLAPQVGDADDGRFLPLEDYGRADMRSHLHLFRQAGRNYAPSTAHAAYRDGGYWIMRSGPLYVLVRCGDVGVGSHAHNDALSFELAFDGQPMIVDPGSYLYTADPVERNRFRSTAFHSTLQLDGAEQNPITKALFAMEDGRQAEALSWDAADGRATFIGRHHGYEALQPPATHARRFELVGGRLTITDSIKSAAMHQAQWTFTLAPCDVKVDGGSVVAEFRSGAVLELRSDDLELFVDDGWLSPSYGRRVRAPFVRARRTTRAGEDVTTVVLTPRV